MGQFSHPNVVKLYGLVTVGDPVRDVIHQRVLFFSFPQLALGLLWLLLAVLKCLNRRPLGVVVKTLASCVVAFRC